MSKNSFKNPDYKRDDTLGWNDRINEFISTIVLSQLEGVEELIGSRKEIAELFLESTEGCDWILL